MPVEGVGRLDAARKPTHEDRYGPAGRTGAENRFTLRGPLLWHVLASSRGRHIASGQCNEPGGAVVGWRDSQEQGRGRGAKDDNGRG
jgi:hypothetical protein